MKGKAQSSTQTQDKGTTKTEYNIYTSVLKAVDSEAFKSAIKATKFEKRGGLCDLGDIAKDAKPLIDYLKTDSIMYEALRDELHWATKELYDSGEKGAATVKMSGGVYKSGILETKVSIFQLHNILEIVIGKHYGNPDPDLNKVWSNKQR